MVRLYGSNVASIYSELVATYGWKGLSRFPMRRALVQRIGWVYLAHVLQYPHTTLFHNALGVYYIWPAISSQPIQAILSHPCTCRTIAYGKWS